MGRRADSGQAAVETALTLPLTLFLILGTLQLFLALQARILAQYAVERAVRNGSLHHANCELMKATAVTVLVPTFQPFLRRAEGYGPGLGRYAKRVKAIVENNFQYKGVPGFKGDVLWLRRERPLAGDLPAAPEDIEEIWSLPYDQQRYELAVRMIFWFPLRIPFANWVIAKAVLAHQGIEPYVARNPYFAAHGASWTQDAGAYNPEAAIATAFRTRVAAREYVLPIHTSAAMRMMSPPRARYLNSPCTF